MPTKSRYGGVEPFERRLAGATAAERAVAAWAEQHGRSVTLFAALPHGAGGGPRLNTLDGAVVAPDLLVSQPRSGRAVLLEVKQRAAWTWHRASRRWLTGFEAAYLDAYLLAQDSVGLPCWAAFLFMEPTTDPRTPEPGPCGLHIARVDRLALAIHHRHHVSAGHCITYWEAGQLCRVASSQDIREAAAARGIEI